MLVKPMELLHKNTCTVCVETGSPCISLGMLCCAVSHTSSACHLEQERSGILPHSCSQRSLCDQSSMFSGAWRSGSFRHRHLTYTKHIAEERGRKSLNTLKKNIDSEQNGTSLKKSFSCNISVFLWDISSYFWVKDRNGNNSSTQFLNFVGPELLSSSIFRLILWEMAHIDPSYVDDDCALVCSSALLLQMMRNNILYQLIEWGHRS